MLDAKTYDEVYQAGVQGTEAFIDTCTRYSLTMDKDSIEDEIHAAVFGEIINEFDGEAVDLSSAVMDGIKITLNERLNAN